MKTLARILFGLSLAVVGLTACKENDLFGEGEGMLALQINMVSNLPTITTRSTITDEELLQHCKVYIRNSKGLVRKFATLDEMPDKLQLVPDNYKAEVTAGDSVAASFTDSYYKGVKDFTIVSGQTVSETIKCGIQNTVVALKLSDELKEAFPSYKISVSNRKGTLEYTPENLEQLGYFMLLSDENQLRWNFEGVVGGSEGKNILKSGIINLVKRATKYELTFSNSSTEVGGGMVTVTVDETALSSDLNVELQARPVIKVIEGNNIFELDNPVYRAVGDKDTPIMVRMAANKPFTEIQISSMDFGRLGIDKFSSFDLMGLTDTQLRELHDLGFSIEFNENITQVQFSFSEELRTIMTSTKEPGKNTYNFDIAVKDQNGKSRAKTLTVITTGALVATDNIPNAEEIWGTRATLYGSLVISTATDLKFRYRATGDADWKNSESATVSGKTFKCVIKELMPNVKYEYQAMSGTVSAEESRFFTTEYPTQLPNSGFEDWQGSAPLYIYKPGDPMFWDSGNTGSATLQKNVTTNDPSIKHSGSYSAKLQSQYVALFGIGAFAAGNIFAGKFLKVDGTDGILRFGRPFATRPSKLKLYYRYISGTVDYSTHADAPKGSKDKAHIYVALGDWPHQTFESETNIPVLVKTKESVRQLFDSNSSNVIGYGEQIVTQSTPGEGLIELTIPIDYRSNRKPTDIVVVASASKYGDFFTGSTGSTLWLDDLELIYE